MTKQQFLFRARDYFHTWKRESAGAEKTLKKWELAGADFKKRPWFTDALVFMEYSIMLANVEFVQRPAKTPIPMTCSRLIRRIREEEKKQRRAA